MGIKILKGFSWVDEKVAFMKQQTLRIKSIESAMDGRKIFLPPAKIIKRKEIATTYVGEGRIYSCGYTMIKILFWEVWQNSKNHFYIK